MVKEYKNLAVVQKQHYLDLAEQIIEAEADIASSVNKINFMERLRNGRAGFFQQSLYGMLRAIRFYSPRAAYMKTLAKFSEIDGRLEKIISEQEEALKEQEKELVRAEKERDDVDKARNDYLLDSDAEDKELAYLHEHIAQLKQDFSDPEISERQKYALRDEIHRFEKKASRLKPRLDKKMYKLRSDLAQAERYVLAYRTNMAMVKELLNRAKKNLRTSMNIQVQLIEKSFLMRYLASA
jgi:chromosome segregation ATPase